MNKVGNIFVRIGRGIKKGFFGLINWIKNTAWIQPLLIVGLIFGVILSIKPIANWIGGIFNPDETYAFYNQNKTDIEDIENRYVKDSKGTVILLFYNDESTTCANIEKTLRNFAATNASVRWYCIDTVENNADRDSNGKTDQDYFNEYFINNFLDMFDESYSNIISNYNNMASSDYADGITWGDDDGSSLSIPTPLFARYDDGKLIGIKPSISSSKTYQDLENFITGNPETDWKTFKLD